MSAGRPAGRRDRTRRRPGRPVGRPAQLPRRLLGRPRLEGPVLVAGVDRPPAPVRRRARGRPRLHPGVGRRWGRRHGRLDDQRGRQGDLCRARAAGGGRGGALERRHRSRSPRPRRPTPTWSSRSGRDGRRPPYRAARTPGKLCRATTSCGGSSGWRWRRGRPRRSSSRSIRDGHDVGAVAFAQRRDMRITGATVLAR